MYFKVLKKEQNLISYNNKKQQVNRLYKINSNLLKYNLLKYFFSKYSIYLNSKIISKLIKEELAISLVLKNWTVQFFRKVY